MTIVENIINEASEPQSVLLFNSSELEDASFVQIGKRIAYQEDYLDNKIIIALVTHKDENGEVFGTDLHMLPIVKRI